MLWNFSVRNLKKMAVLSQKYLWDPLLMKLLKIVKKTSKKLKFINPRLVEKTLKKALLFVKKLDRHFKNL